MITHKDQSNTYDMQRETFRRGAFQLKSIDHIPPDTKLLFVDFVSLIA